jgi:large subunit ribosomal protein L24
MKLKVGDTVVVIAGKHRNETGKIIKLDKKNNRVVVEGINKVKRHVPKRGGQAGQIVEFEASMDASNVQYLDAKSKKGSRLGYQIDKDGKKQRIAKKSNTVIN